MIAPTPFESRQRAEQPGQPTADDPAHLADVEA
jgi:hypothetical protein